MKLPEKNCPECGGPISWKTIIGFLGAPQVNGICRNCNILFKNREDPDITKGKKLAENLIGVGAMDKRITGHNTITQIGILRAKQHCRTCGKPSYPIESSKDKCHCKKCKCPYCQERK